MPEQVAVQTIGGADKMNAEFQMTTRDYGLVAEISCVAADNNHPNQGDLRHYIDKLLNALGNWEHVEVVIKTVEKS